MGFVGNYVILPLLIFLARVADVSLGTIRIIFISKGFRFLSPLVGFFEVIIWLLAINQILSDFSNVWLCFAYATGFAVGNYVGILLEEKISIGSALVRIIVRKNPKRLINELKKENYHMTIIEGRSGYEKTDVKIIFSVVKRKKLRQMFKIIREINPHAFFTIEDVRNARKDGYSSSIDKNILTRKHK